MPWYIGWSLQPGRVRWKHWWYAARLPPTLSLTPLLTDSPIHWFPHALTHWLTHWLTQTTHWLTDCLARSLPHSLTHWHTHSFTHSLDQSTIKWRHGSVNWLRFTNCKGKRELIIILYPWQLDRTNIKSTGLPRFLLYESPSSRILLHMYQPCKEGCTLIARFMGPSWGPPGPGWAPCWPHEPCYLGNSPVVCVTSDDFRRLLYNKPLHRRVLLAAKAVGSYPILRR